MAVGFSSAGAEEQVDDALDMPPTANIFQTPRPFKSPGMRPSSPRMTPCKHPCEMSFASSLPSPVLRPLDSPQMTPCKRPLDTAAVFSNSSSQAPCAMDAPQTKRSKLALYLPETVGALSLPETAVVEEGNQLVSELQRNMDVLKHVLPERALPEEGRKLAPARLPSLRGPRPNRALKQAVKVAMRLYTKALTEFALDKDLKGEVRAEELAEDWAKEHYCELKDAILALLPFTGELMPAKAGTYDLVKFQGRRTRDLRFGRKREVCKQQLEHFRRAGERARAWEALCAVLSAISSRKEKNWLEYHDVLRDLEAMLKNMPRCKSNRSARRREAIREMVPQLVEKGAGAFAFSLLDPRCTHHVTFARVSGGPLPASSMTTRRMPLWDALKTMDDDGPLRGAAKNKEWCRGAGRQFALQDLDLSFGQKSGSRKERMCARGLLPDRELRDLLRSKKRVVLLDTLAALAPREICKTQRLSEIVKSELLTMLREAKARGEAVVFSLGGEFPHELAQKVYLRPPLADYGMRVGSLRWRESADKPWAREFKWDDRITLCLQMP